MKKEIQHRVGIKATPAAVYLALTDPKKLAQWWTTDVRGESEIGKNLEFWFGQFCQPMQVAALEANSLVRWLVTDQGISEWIGTEIEFRITADGEQTFVYFKHSGWKDEESELFAHCSTKWAVFLISLKELLETGKGRPSPNDIQIDD
jgi:uncharacterized protein YndB with AHSA1/START domain